MRGFVVLFSFFTVLGDPFFDGDEIEEVVDLFKGVRAPVKRLSEFISCCEVFVNVGRLFNYDQRR
jgi:hypothetical protein